MANSARKSLRTVIISQFGLLTVTVAAICGFLVYSSFENRQSIRVQQAVNADYRTALMLDESIDDLLYFGAELSNSLSDESYDAFLSASEMADKHIEDVPNPDLRRQLRQEKEIIADNAIRALDAYVVDDRATGDTHTRAMQSASAKLDEMVQANVDYFEGQRAREETAILRRTDAAQHVASVAAVFSLLIIVGIVAQMWRQVFKPIEVLIASISGASGKPESARSFMIADLPANEVGQAGAALNKLLQSVETSIVEAETRANEAEVAQTRWRAIFNESPDAIVIVDPASTALIECNPATSRLLCLEQEGIGSTDGSGLPTALEIHRHEVRELKKFLSDVMSTGRARTDELSCNIDDNHIPVSVVGVTVPHETGHAILLHIRDISEQRAYEAELKAAREAAENAAESKSNFLANMSHEIRTPMNGIMGMTEVLANTELTPKQQNFVGIINKSSNALLTIINDILDFSKIDSGQISFDNQPFNLKTVVEDVIALIATKAEQKNLELIVRYQPRLTEGFIGDDGRVRQILMNLIGNAIKFTERGHVLVDVSGTVLAEETRLMVKVVDTGIGIPEAKLQAIFEKFNQVDNSATRKFEGTGLGLAICRMLIEKMGGDIGVESREGYGSQFWFEVTLPNSELAEKERIVPVDMGDARVLIVDDNATNREILVEQMTSWSIEPRACASGNEALEVLAENPGGRPAFNAVIMDYQMPELNGIQVFQALSERLGDDNPPCLLLTSVGDDEVRRQAKACGIDIALTKPARSSELFNALIEMMGRRNARLLDGVVQKAASPTVSKDKAAVPADDKGHYSTPGGLSMDGNTILVAEDNVVNQAVVGELLKAIGCKFALAQDGRIAVDKVDLYQPDIVLMDVSMPVMNGYEATAEIRKRDEKTGRRTIIIGLTANALKGDREKCLDAGMDDYLSKPIDMKRLKDCIVKWRKERAQAQSVA